MAFSRRASRIFWAATAGVGVAAAGTLGLAGRPLLVATGVEVTGAPTTVAPSLFDPPPTPRETPPVGDGIVGPADRRSPGAAPDPATLQTRLDSLDVRTLAAAAERLQLGYQVLDSATGEVLAQRGQAVPLVPASTTKLLTVAAVLASLEPQARFATTVVQPAPGRIVLVGGGDPLLAAAAPAPDAYPRPASLQELAAATAKALLAKGQTSVALAWDDALFGDAWNGTWPANYRDQVTPISALWADEGRDAGHARSREPAALAAATFAAQLTRAGVKVVGEPTRGAAAGPELARVESPPVHVLAEETMLRSNNSFAEVLGRQVALATGHPGTFAGAVAGIEQELTGLGLWDEGAALFDASGLSRSNRVTPAMLARAMRHVATDPGLAVILDGLPVAGATGTLADRFGDSVAAPARGVARAKTGTLSFVATLAGVTTTADGRDVVFSFMTNGSADGWAAKVWTDQGVGVVTGCGC